MKFRQLTKLYEEEGTSKSKNLSAGGCSVTIRLEQTGNGKWKVSVSGSIDGSSEYESRSQAESRYMSLDSCKDVASWLGDTRYRSGYFHGGHGSKPEKPDEPDPEPPPPDNGGGEPAPAPAPTGGSPATEKKKVKVKK